MNERPLEAPLRFPLAGPPETGAHLEIQSGLFWLRQRLPFELDHINVYAFGTDDEWTAVDTGINSRSSQTTWTRFIDERMGGRRPQRLIGTHLHPDHIGLAGWFARELDAPVWMTRTEYLHCRILVADTGREAPPEGVEFYRRAGLNDDALQRYRDEFGGFGRAVAPLPESYRRLREGDVVEDGGHRWRVVLGAGHSPEHACLFDEARNIFLSGDQLLPTISSNVSVWPTEPDGNPLDDWLSSCRRLMETINDSTLVCPAHGEPFTGGPGRLRSLIGSHERKLALAMSALDRPMRVVDVSRVLFERVDPQSSLLAVGETTAHLNYLIATGAVARERRDGVHWYVAAT